MVAGWLIDLNFVRQEGDVGDVGDEGDEGDGPWAVAHGSSLGADDDAWYQCCCRCCTVSTVLLH